jgi:hypothetical protein
MSNNTKNNGKNKQYYDENFEETLMFCEYNLEE